MSFHTIPSTGGKCQVCLNNFSPGDLILAHKDMSSDENIHKIHSLCLDPLLASSTTFKCPECRLQITSINGTAVQPIPQLVGAVPRIQQDHIALQIANGGAPSNLDALLALNDATENWLGAGSYED